MKEKQSFTPAEFRRAVELTKKASCCSFATLADLKKMLGCSMMDVMTYIDEHPELVHTEEKHKVKFVKVRQTYPGLKPFYSSEPREGASLGLCVIDAYENEEDNPFTEKGLERLIKDHERTIWVSEVSDYGQIIGHTIDEDLRPTSLKSSEVYTDHRKNHWLWRNTHKKVEELLDKGFIKPKVFWKGGLGDSYSVPGNEVTAENIAAIEKDGWTVIGKWF